MAGDHGVSAVEPTLIVKIATPSRERSEVSAQPARSTDDLPYQ
jgi:hypothetical protein